MVLDLLVFIAILLSLNHMFCLQVHQSVIQAGKALKTRQQHRKKCSQKLIFGKQPNNLVLVKLDFGQALYRRCPCIKIVIRPISGHIYFRRWPHCMGIGHPYFEGAGVPICSLTKTQLAFYPQPESSINTNHRSMFPLFKTLAAFITIEHFNNVQYQRRNSCYRRKVLLTNHLHFHSETIALFNFHINFS